MRKFLCFWLVGLTLITATFAVDLPTGAFTASPEVATSIDKQRAELQAAITAHNANTWRDLIYAYPQLLKENYDGLPLLQYCIRVDNLAAFTFALEHGADVNMTDSGKRTPLIYAAQQIRLPFIKVLLEQKNLRSFETEKTGLTALAILQNFTPETLTEFIRTEKRATTTYQLEEQINSALDLLTAYQRRFSVSEEVLFTVVPDDLRRMLKLSLGGFPAWKYLLALGCLLVVRIIVWLWRKLLDRLHLAQTTETATALGVTYYQRVRSFGHHSLDATRRPIIFLLWSSGAIVIGGLFLPALYESFRPVFAEILVIAAAIFVYDFAIVAEEVAGLWLRNANAVADKTLLALLRRVLRFAVVFFVCIHLYHLFSGSSLTAVLAGLGLGGMAIALAATDTLKNFIGFLMILLDQPFAVGDRIVINDYDGIVEYIGLRTVRLRRIVDSHLICIPNVVAVDSIMRNIARRRFFRRTLKISLVYAMPPEKIRAGLAILQGLLLNHENQHPDYPPRVYFTDLATYSLDLTIDYWYFSDDWWSFQDFNQRFNLQVLEKFKTAEIALAFPTQTIYTANA